MYMPIFSIGHRLKGRDVLHGGIATHFIGKDKVLTRYFKLVAIQLSLGLGSYG